MRLALKAIGLAVVAVGIVGSASGTALADDPLRFPGSSSKDGCDALALLAISHNPGYRNWACYYEGPEDQWVLYLSDN